MLHAVFFSMRPPYTDPLLPLAGRAWTFKWDLADPEGQAWRLEGTLTRDRDGSDRWYFQEPSPRNSTHRECASGDPVAATTLDAVLWEGRAKTGYPPVLVQISFPSATVRGIRLAYHYAPAEPESGLTLLNRFEVNAATGHLHEAYLPSGSSWL
jgi:hypothetical protein